MPRTLPNGCTIRYRSNSDRSEIMDALYRRTIVHHSQDLVVQPTLRRDCMYTLQSASILAPTISSSSHLQQNDNEKMEADNDDGSLIMGAPYRNTRIRHSQDLVPHSGASHHNGNRMDSNLGLLPGFDPAYISDSQSTNIRNRSNSDMEEDLDDSADTSTPDALTTSRKYRQIQKQATSETKRKQREWLN